MAVFSGIVFGLQACLLAMALTYVRHKAIISPGEGYHLWKPMAIASLLPFGISLFTFVSIRSLSSLLFVTLSIVALGLGILVMSLYYFRPRYFANKGKKSLGVWKFVSVLGILTIILGLVILIVFSL